MMSHMHYYSSFRHWAFVPATDIDDIVFLVLAITAGLIYNVYLREKKKDIHHHIWFEKPQAASLDVRRESTRDVGRMLEQNNKDLVIFWGSQSGTAERLAGRLVRDLRSRFGLDSLLADLSDYDTTSIANILETKFAIFIVSTYGEGDPSDNATQFLSFLDSNTVVLFPNLRYAAFGLGNKKYKFYNRVVDLVQVGLDRLGAQALMPVEKADDSNGTTDEDFIEWKKSLFRLLKTSFGFEERPEQYEPTLDIIEDTSLDVIDLHTGEPVSVDEKPGSMPRSSICPLEVKVAKQLLNKDNRKCLHLELDTSEFPELKYKTGDHIAIWPTNPISEIERLVRILGLKGRLDTPLLIKSMDASMKVKVPSPTTWKALLGNYLEICAPVSRETVLSLANFATSHSSKTALQTLAGCKDTYNLYCAKNHVTISRLLEQVSGPADNWEHLPASFILEILPSLSPRFYSISSSAVISPKQISITVAMTNSPPWGYEVYIPGLATTYLQAVSEKRTQYFASATPEYDFQSGNTIKLHSQIRPSKFRLPTLSKHPIIMVAAGSGIAPFRAFLQERLRMLDIGRDTGTCLLFFGCRSSDDYLYRDEMEAMSRRSHRIEVVTAFSRTGEKVYVQDEIVKRDERVIQLLMEDNAYFYICGSSGMARDVARRLGEALKRRMGWGEDELRSWSEGVKRGRRWQEDVWG